MKAKPRFCPQCGSSLNNVPCEGRVRPVCSSCGFVVYENPAPSVAAVLIRNGRILLVKRNIEPGLGKWCLPGGFVETGETIYEAAAREVREETGIRCTRVKFVDVETVLDGFYGDIIVLCCKAEVNGDIPAAGGDADEAAYFDLEALPQLAFDVHQRFIRKYGSRDVDSN